MIKQSNAVKNMDKQHENSINKDHIIKWVACFPGIIIP